MNFSLENNVSINAVLADALVMLNDESTKELSKGYYKRQVKNALKEIGFETNFLEVKLDLDIPHNLKLSVPKNMYNIQDIFVWHIDRTKCLHDDSVECSSCKVSGPERVFHKYNYVSDGKGMGYTARNHEGNPNDPFIPPAGHQQMLKWYNIQSGMIMLSPTCGKPYNRMRIVAKGIPAGDIDEANIVPEFCREAIMYWTVEKCALSLIKRDPTYSTIWKLANSKLYTAPSRGESSVWDEAKYRLCTLDDKERSDLLTYFEKMNY